MKSTIASIFSKIAGIFTGIWARKGQKKVWIPAVIIVLFIFMNMGGSSKDSGVYIYTVNPREFVQKVELTGKVIAAKNVDMGFEAAGRVSKVAVKVGDVVKKGQILASLENGDYTASLQKNYALLKDIQSGSKQKEVGLSENELENAKRELALNTQALADQLKDIYTKADDAIRFKIDNSFRNPRSVNPEFLYPVDRNPILTKSLGTQRLKISEMFVDWNSNTGIAHIAQIRQYIVSVQNFINDANTAISTASEQIGSGDSAYADLAAKKTEIALARTTFSTAVAALNQAEIAYNNSLSAVSLAERRLTIKTTGSDTDLDIQRANLQSAQALVAKTIIRAPFDGVITKVDIKEGEISSPNTPVIALLNDGEYQIETYVSENDIAKLVVGQTAQVSLDAYGRDVFFTASVISVDPAETVKDGVSTYRTKIQFTDKDPRIKSGMTANISIETDRRPDVLVIPQSGLFLERGVKKTYIIDSLECVGGNSMATSTPISAAGCADILKAKKGVSELKTGQINSTGEIEILGGIEPGSTIIYSVKETK